jgi:hypothetical protein
MVEHPMILVGILAAFALFGVALAYVDRIASRRPDPDGTPAE